MKKKEKKPVAKKEEKPVAAPVVAQTPAVEEKTKVMFTPEVEKPEGVEEVKPAEQVVAGIVQPEPVVIAGVTGTTSAVNEVSTAVVGEVKPEQVVQPEQPVQSEKPEVPAGALARSIDTLAAIVDQPQETKTGTGMVGGLTEKPAKRSGRGGGALGMFLAFVIGLCFGLIAGYWLWGRFVMGGVAVLVENEQKIDQQSGVVPTVAVSPTPAQGMLRKDLKVKVLNGTGGKGVAAAGKEYLEGLGYVDVGTGNAKRSDYTQTEVILAKAKTDFWPVLKEDLIKKYTVADGFTTDDELLTANGGVDALVIIGE